MYSHHKSLIINQQQSTAINSNAHPHTPVVFLTSNIIFSQRPTQKKKTKSKENRLLVLGAWNYHAYWVTSHHHFYRDLFLLSLDHVPISHPGMTPPTPITISAGSPGSVASKIIFLVPPGRPLKKGRPGLLSPPFFSP